MRRQGAAIGVAGPDETLKVIERLPKAFVTEMRHVEDDAQPFHLLEQFASALAEPARGVRALRIPSRPIVRRAQRTKPLREGTLEVFECHDRVRAFKTKDVTDGRIGRRMVVPGLKMLVQASGVLDLHHLRSEEHTSE